MVSDKMQFGITLATSNDDNLQEIIKIVSHVVKTIYSL